MAEERDSGERASPKAIVREGWNRVSAIYRPEGAHQDVFHHSDEDHAHWLRPIVEALPRGSTVLDLGCGSGVPDCALLAKRFDVTGVDISEVQIERARAHVPSARFVRADMTEVRFPPASFDAVVCMYALIHVPVDEQPGLLRRVHDWLVPGGHFLLLTGHEAYTGIEPNWLGGGAAMYWSHADAETYGRWLGELHFQIVSRTVIPEHGPLGPNALHELFYLRSESEGPAVRPRARDPGTMGTAGADDQFPTSVLTERNSR